MDWKSDDLLFGAEIEEFRTEKTVKADKVTSLDEIEKLCVDEGLGETDKVILLLGSSFDVQKVWAVNQVVPLLKKHGNSNLVMKLLPKVKLLLKPPVSGDIQRAVSQCFGGIAQESSLQFVSFSTHIFPNILSELENASEANSELWLECLVASLGAISKDIIKHKVLNLVRSRCQLSQSIKARQSSCIIIGQVANKMEAYWIKQELVPLVRALCQDVDPEVRMKMCKELPRVAEALGTDITKTFILPEMEELSKDDQVDVRRMALSSLYEILPLVDEDCRKDNFIPLLIRFLEDATGIKRTSEEDVKHVDQLRVNAARLIGRLCYDLKDLYSSENVKTLLDMYTDLSKTDAIATPIKSVLIPPLKTQAQSSSAPQSGLIPVDTDNDYGTECRRMCAYNVPGMVLFSSSFNKVDEVLIVLKNLSHDSDWKVRLAVSLGYHEVIKHFDNDSKRLIRDYAALLQDNQAEVVSGLVKGLPIALEVFAKALKLDHKTRQPGLTDLIQPLLTAEQTLSKHRQWRYHRDLLDTFVHLRHCMTSDQLFNSFVPVLWRCIGVFRRPVSCKGKSNNYVLPVKRAAFMTLCLCISSVRKADNRKEICSKFISDCAQSNSYKQRLLFIEVCQMILDNFSRNFFKENGFFAALLALSKDSTMNVRYCLCSMLPQLKSVILLPVDREYQAMLESAIADLLMDRHSECVVSIRQSVKQMDRINYRMQSMVTYSLEDDVMDKEREDAEKLMLKEEEEWEREREKEVSSHRLYPERKSAPVTRNSPSINKKRLAVKGQTQQQLSPGGLRKANASQGSPGTSAKLTPGTPDLSKRTAGDQTSPDLAGKHVSKATGRQTAGSSPNILVSSTSPKPPKAKLTTGTKLSPASSQGHHRLSHSVKATGSKRTTK